jgi:hypothetical protein
MGRGQMQAFPGEVQLDLIGANSFTPANNPGQAPGLVNGIALIPDPVGPNGAFKIPAATGNLSSLNSNKDYIRGYFQTYNFTIQKELMEGWIGQVGYVGMHSVQIQTGFNINYGQLGGGSASQLLAKYNNFAAASVLLPFVSGNYNSLQATLNKRFSHGLAFQSAYTYSKDIALSTSSTTWIPELRGRIRTQTTADRTHHLILSGSYDLPFGKGKKFAQQAVASAILGGWTVTGIFNHWSGAPFNVTASGSSCNCPGTTQIADQIKPTVAIVGSGVNSQPYFDPTAYAPVTAARLGTSGYYRLRGPGNNNLDMGLLRIFPITERIKFQLRAEALNFTNTPHFNNPGNSVSNASFNSDGSVRSLGGFSQITSTNPLGRIIDQRYIRFGARITF